MLTFLQKLFTFFYVTIVPKLFEIRPNPSGVLYERQREKGTMTFPVTVWKKVSRSFEIITDMLEKERETLLYFLSILQALPHSIHLFNLYVQDVY